MIIRNGMTAFPGGNDFLIRDIWIEQGRIKKITSGLAGYPDASEHEIIDAGGFWVLPGGIDPHVHFYDPGLTEKEDFYHGSAFAAQGGITTVIDMPCTSYPPVSNVDNLEKKLSSVSSKAVIDFGFYGGASRQNSDKADFEAEISALSRRVMGIKAYTISGVEDEWGAFDYYRLFKLFKTAAALNIPVLLHAEERSYVDNASEEKIKTGKNHPADWYESRPELAEILAVSSALRLARETGVSLHIVHVGTAEAAELIQKASGDSSHSAGAVISGETCPQYLAFSKDDFEKLGAVLKIAPPVKSAGNADGLWKALNEGHLSFVSSDHAPGTEEEKSGNNIWENSAGIAGCGTLLPYIFSEGYLAGKLTLSRYLEVMSENAPKRFGFFDRKGSIEVGKDADFVLINSRADWNVRAQDFLSKGKLSPFEGKSFRGRVEKTIVRGRVVYEYGKGITAEKGWGQFIEPARI